MSSWQRLLFLFILGLSLTLEVKTWMVDMEELLVDYPDRLLLLEDQGLMVVGARNELLAVNPMTLEVFQKQSVKPFQSAKETCYNQGRMEDDCSNYIRVLLVKDNGTLLVCGTNAFHPHCDVRQLSNLSEVITTEKIPHDDFSVYQRDNRYFSVCPFDPDEGSVAMIMDGQYYAASEADRSQRNVFYKVNFDGTDLAGTDIEDPNWIATLDFYPLKVFEFGDSIFLIYREVATEKDYDTIVTRIAKICKGDNGTKEESLIHRWLWKTFVKGTLKCSVKTGSQRYDFDYNEMVSVSNMFDINGKQHFVGVFRTVQYGPPASAVCVFGMEDVLGMFKLQYRYHEANEWKISSNEPTVDCQNMRSGPSKFLLIADPLRQKGTLPLIMESYTVRSEMLNQVAVVPVKAVNGSDCFVMIIGTDDGNLIRSWSCGMYAQVFDKQKYFTTDGGIKKLMVNIPSEQREKTTLYITTNDRLAKVSVFTCHYNQTRSCVYDPLCAWDIIDKRCVIRPQDYTFDSNATLRYPNITVNASYTPDLLPTLAPSTVDAMTAQPTTNLETPTATETDTVVQATNCANISSQAVHSGDDDDDTCLSVPVIAGTSVAVCGIGLLIGMLVGYFCGHKVRIHKADLDSTTLQSRVESQPKLRSRKEIHSVGYCEPKPTVSYSNHKKEEENYLSNGKVVISDHTHGVVINSEYEASPQSPSALKPQVDVEDSVERSISVQSAASTNELLTNRPSNKYP